ncbi:MAG: hypothetical protein P4L99_05535 [Chthoniobacter sp.]|nr:hypothetical protein [Chthoniobacter sp.]
MMHVSTVESAFVHNDQTSVPIFVTGKIRTIDDIAKERNAALRGYSDNLRATMGDLMLAKSRLDELERGGLKDEPAIADMQGKMTEIEAEMARLRVQNEDLGTAWRQALKLSENLSAYISANASVIKLHKGPGPALQNGERARDGLERAARRTRALQADRREVMAAPIPAALAKDLAWQQVQARADAAKPDVTSLIDHGGRVKFPTVRTAIEQHGSMSDLFAVDPVALLAWCFPNEVKAAIDREIDENAEDEIALSSSERIERLATIDADILWSEREECAFSELAGLLPRADIDPRAALGLADTMPAPTVVRGD